MPFACSALTTTTRGCHVAAGVARRRPSISRISRAVCAASGRSPLLIARMSAISSVPALIACTSSPRPGGQTTTRVSASAAMRVSDWPVPTVSTITRSKPAASKQSTAARVARDNPPSSPRAESERMKTFGSAPCSPMRTRSPSTAPPVMGLDGSMAMTATCRPRSSHAPSSALTRLDLPLPGTPVMPTTRARPARAREPRRDLARFGRVVVEQRQQAGDGAAVAGQGALAECRCRCRRCRGFGACRDRDVGHVVRRTPGAGRSRDRGASGRRSLRWSGRHVPHPRRRRRRSATRRWRPASSRRAAASTCAGERSAFHATKAST